MKKKRLIQILLILVALLIVGCQSGAESEPEVITETVVEQVEVEVTRIVEGEVVVETITEEVEVEVTRVVEVQAEEETETRPNVLRVAMDVPDFADPHRFHGRNINLLENIYEPLVYPFEDTQEIRPVLAESWDASEDGSVYTFTLHDGITFHDGTPLTSADVKFSFERMMDLGEALQEDELNRVVQEIAIPDDQTVVFTITPGGPPFLAVICAVLIVSQDAIEANATDDDPWATEWMSQNSSGSGPYVLESLQVGDSMRIVRFDDYWQGWEGDHVDEVLYLMIPEPSTQLLMLERGEVDISFNVPLESIETLRENPNLEIFQQRGNYLFYLRMNTHGGPLTDINLRKAFAHAFDYEAYIQARADYFPTDGPAPAHFLDGFRPEGLPEYDIELAQEFYEAAGYGPDNPLSITQFIVTGQDYQQVAAEIMQQGMAQLGVEYNILPGEFSPYYSGLLRYVNEGDESGYLDMFTLRMPSTIPDPVAFFTAYQTGSSLNMMGYSNPDVDALISQALNTPDQAERNALYQEAADIIVEDYVDIWLGVERRTAVYDTEVQGFYSHPLWWPALHVYPISLSNTE